MSGVETEVVMKNGVRGTRVGVRNGGCGGVGADGSRPVLRRRSRRSPHGSGRFAVVMLEQPSDPLFADDLTLGRSRRSRGLRSPAPGRVTCEPPPPSKRGRLTPRLHLLSDRPHTTPADGMAFSRVKPCPRALPARRLGRHVRESPARRRAAPACRAAHAARTSPRHQANSTFAPRVAHASCFATPKSW